MLFNSYMTSESHEYTVCSMFQQAAANTFAGERARMVVLGHVWNGYLNQSSFFSREKPADPNACVKGRFEVAFGSLPPGASEEADERKYPRAAPELHKEGIACGVVKNRRSPRSLA